VAARGSIRIAGHHEIDGRHCAYFS
jgi:hypothetical protein